MMSKIGFASAILAVTVATGVVWAGSKETKASAITIDRTFAYDVGNDCKYTSTVKGTLQPIQKKNAATLYRPSLDVRAKLACPNAVASEETDEVRSGESFTRDQLAQMIAFRTSFIQNEGDKKCAYVPNVEFDGKQLKSEKVDYLCPAPKPPTATGGGKK